MGTQEPQKIEPPVDPYGVTPRKRLSTKARFKIFMEHKGVCCICQGKIREKSWILEHIQPLWLNGTNESENLAPAHEKCAKSKTQREAKERAKGRRIAEKHFGASRPTSVMPGSKRSPWKKKLNGEVERRER